MGMVESRLPAFALRSFLFPVVEVGVSEDGDELVELALNGSPVRSPAFQ